MCFDLLGGCVINGGSDQTLNSRVRVESPTFRPSLLPEETCSGTRTEV